jgi:hypothetical protein
MNIRALGLALISLAAAAAPPTAEADAPATRPAVRPYDLWYSCFLGTQKLGWIHATRAVRNGEVHSTEALSVSIRRGEVAATVGMDSLTVETTDGKPVRFRVKSSVMGLRQVTAGRVEGDKLHVTTASLTGTQKRTVPLDPEALWTLGMERALEARGFKPGTRLEAKAYLPSSNAFRPLRVVLSVLEPIRRRVGGREMLLRRVRMVLLDMGGATSTMLLDENSDLVQGEAAMGGLQIRYVRTSRKEAMKPGSAELFLSTLVKLDKPLPPRWGIRRAVYRLRTANGAKVPDLPSGAGQTVTREAPDRLRVLVNRPQTDPPAPATRPYRGEKPMAAYLASTGVIDHADKQITAAAGRVVGEQTNALAAARKLERFVHAHIRSKNLSRGQDPASVVMKRREGDCSEHAVLLAALCRAAGIPARCASGLVYADSLLAAGPIFAYHMWTEVWIGDRWVGLDATLARGRTSATHIRLASSAMSDEEGILAYAAIVPLVANLKIEVVETTLDEE